MSSSLPVTADFRGVHFPRCLGQGVGWYRLQEGLDSNCHSSLLMRYRDPNPVPEEEKEACGLTVLREG